MVTDGQGNVAIAGTFEDTMMIWPKMLVSEGTQIFSSLSSTAPGSVIRAVFAGGQWRKAVNGTGNTGANISSFGNSFILSVSHGTDVGSPLHSTAVFDTATLDSELAGDVFIARHDQSARLVWASSAGGKLNDNAFANAVDKHGNVYITGVFSSRMNFGSYQLNELGASCSRGICSRASYP